jgi:hypothetical protein
LGGQNLNKSPNLDVKQADNTTVNTTVLASEEIAYIVPYDIPSENFLQFKESQADSEDVKALKQKMLNYVKAQRIKATYYLHSLGVLCTNSVVLVPKSKSNEIDQVISKVEEIYRETNKTLLESGFNEIGRPIVKKIAITQQQLVPLRELAEKRLMEKIDEKIDEIARLLNEIESITDEEKKKRLERNLMKMRKENEDIEEIAKELCLKCLPKTQVLGALIAKALESLRGE